MIGGKLVRHKKEFENTLSKETKKLLAETAKMNKKRENDIFLNTLKQTEKIQKETLDKLKKPNSKTLKEKSLKLPLTIKEIDDDPYLSSILLKNPEFMTVEEKGFIDSFNKKEQQIFFQYLRVKSLEKNWMGNGIGSGQFLELYMKNKKKKDENGGDKLITLKAFLKKNLNTEKQIKDKNNEDQEDSYIQNMKEDTTKQLIRLNVVKSLEDKKREEMENFKLKAKNLTNELEKFKLMLLKEKNEAVETKLIEQNKYVKTDIANKTKNMKKDMNRIEDNKDKISESSYLIQNYNKHLNDNRNNIIFEDKIFQSIRDYLDQFSMTAYELLKLIDMNIYETQEIRIDRINEKMIKLNVLSTQEAYYLSNMLKEYFGEKIKTELFQNLIEKKSQGNKDEESFEDLIKNYYDNIKENNNPTNNNQLSNRSYENSLREKILSSRNLGEFNYIIRNKGANLINANVKGFLMRKKVKLMMLSKLASLKVIVRAFRKYFNKRKEEKNKAALKIQLLMKKNYTFKEKERLLLSFTHNWVNKKQPTRTFAALTIQRYWRLFKKQMLDQYITGNKPKVDMSLIQTKVCFICKNNKVDYLCADCGGNHFCNLDFIKYHSKGRMKNHDYIAITQKKINKTKLINLDIQKIREYLKTNKIVLYEHLKMWDFKKNSLIKIKHLKDALSSKFFHFKKEYADILIVFSCHYLADNSNLSDVDDCFFKYEEMCLDLI